MRWLRWLAAAVAAVAILVVALVAFVATLDLNAYKDDIQAALEGATGRKVRIGGDISLSWTPRPSLTAAGVRVANAEWGSAPDMATVGRLAVGVELLPLLSGRAEVHRLHLSDVRVLLERDGNGRGNWETGGTPAAVVGGGEVPSIQRLDLAQAAVVWRSGPGAPEQVYRIDRLSLTEAADGAVEMTVAADLDGRALELAGTVPRPRTIGLPGSNLPVDVQGSLAGTPLALAATFQIGGRTIQADAIETAYGELSVKGAGSIDLNGARPRVDARLQTGTLDFASLGADGGAAGDPLDRPLPVDLITLVDGKVELKADRVIAGGLALDEVAATATLADGLLTVDPIAAKVADAAASGRLELDARKPPVRVALAGDARGMDMGSVYRALAGEALIEGRGDYALELRGSGDTPRKLLGSADGVSRLVVHEGVILNRYWELIAEDVATRFLPFIEEADRGRLNCLVSRFDIAKGIADASVLMVDSERVTIAGEGTVDLAKQTMDMRLVPRPKDPSLFSLATPILLTGPLTDPRPAPDPVAVAKGLGSIAATTALGPVGLLLPFVSSGSASQPCPEAIAAAEGKRPPTRAKSNGEQDKPGNIKGLFDSLRKSLE